MRTPWTAADPARLAVAGILAVVLLALYVNSPHAAHAEPIEAEDAGVPMLREAALAGRTRSYEGLQYVSTWGPGGERTSLIEVDHSVPGSERSGVMAPSDAMLAVLDRNYRIDPVGSGSVMGRAAQVVEVRRYGGPLAARFWIDRDSKLMLRREIHDPRGKVIHAGVYIDLRVSPAAAPVADTVAFAASSAAGAAPHQSDLGFPRRLGSGHELISAQRHGAYVHAVYADGLSVVSVFVQPGALNEERLRGWREETGRGYTVWVRDAVLKQTIWDSGGHVYTVLADAPADTVDAAVADLPHEPRPSPWSRISRGLDRVVSWVNPFE